MAKLDERQKEQIRQQAQMHAQQDFILSQQMQARQQALIAHEEKNRTHDTEFSPYSEGEGEPTLGVIGETEVKKAYDTLLKYKEQKAYLERKLTEDEICWKMRHWELMSNESDQRIKPKSAWLFNTIINKHADAMDNFPEANILPRSKDDEQVAEVLTSVIPVILEQNGFQKTYSDEQWQKMKHGTGVYGVFWNNDKNNGMGDIDIRMIDLHNLFWQGGVTDIQDSANVFHVTMMDDDEIKARWPFIQPASSGLLPLTLYNNDAMDEKVDYTNCTAVIDWYYRRRLTGTDQNGIPKVRTVLHYCKFCNGQVIYASENDPTYAQDGWYSHGKYPFVFDVLYPVENSICGLGLVDIVKDDQLFIDKLQQAILENAVANARPRAIIRSDGGINEQEWLDLSRPLVHTTGNLGENDIRPITGIALNGIYENIYLQKVQEMKDTSGNTASTQGQASSVTSASGIASLQEAAGKLSRDSNMEAFRAFQDMVNLVIELIRQFYDEPRCFRILGEFGKNEFVEFDNSGLLPQQQGSVMGIDLGSRLPILDIEVCPQKKSAYSKESQNQTAISLYQMGLFSPQNADASLACLDMMDFDGIDDVREDVARNQTLLKQVMELQQMVAQLASMIRPEQAQAIMAQMQGAQQAELTRNQSTGKASQPGNGSLSKQAATATRNSTAPR